LVEELISLGVDGLELEYRIPEALYEDMKPALKETQVFSIHNYFPVPDILLPSEGSGEAFRLTALDEEERRLAVEYTKRSLRAAAELGAGHLVIHSGEVEACRSAGRGLMKAFKESESAEYEKVRLELIEERQLNAGPHLDILYSSLEAVLEEAAELKVNVCMENRYYLHEFPSFREVGEILTKFNGARLRYWHDVGHAVVQDILGSTPRLQWLKEYKDHLAGIHLHDVAGIHDHKAPGLGDVFFEELNDYINDDVVKIIEVHQGASREEIQDGIEILRQQGFC
jgi:sugar phosphate isomerase/epimerase